MSESNTSKDGNEQAEDAVEETAGTAPPTDDFRKPAVEVRASRNVAAVPPEAPPRPDPFTAVWYKNPFVVSFLIGVVTITWLHGRLRHVPDPPPVVGELAVGGWTDASGADLDGSVFAESVTVVGFVEPGAEVADCGAPRLLSKLWFMFQDEDIDARVMTVSLGAGEAKDWAALEGVLGSRENWTFAGPTTPEAAEALSGALATARPEWDEWRAQNPRPPARILVAEPPPCASELLRDVVLVDADGNLRGFYQAQAWDVESELFHRVQHILRVQAEE